ncbi:ABC transporter ATP-binding protein [Catenulispora yoronensis]|uniref:ABC transporter ATP-binding protein n=1 Tax=Catenulispora yoronensis TaxID=450799 RepID=UPI0031D9FDE2
MRVKPLTVPVLAVLTLASGTLGTIAALLMRTVVDRVQGHEPWSRLEPEVALLAAVGVVTALVPPCAQYLQSQIRRATAVVVQDRLVDAVTAAVGIAGLEDPAAQDRLRLAGQAVSGSDQMLGALLNTAQAVVSVAGFTAALAAVNPWLAALALLAAVPRLITQLRLNRRRAAMQLGTGGAVRRQMAVRMLLLDANAGMEIRLFGLGGLFRERLAADLRAVNDAERGVDRRALSAQAPLALLGAALGAGGLVWAVAMAGRGRLTIGDVTVFVAALAAVQGGVASAVASVASLDQSAISFRHLFAVQDEGRRSRHHATAASVLPGPDRLREGVEFRDVWFRYHPGAPWILRGVTLRIAPGETVALVGLNGAGKSTLVKLLCRFYEPDRGRILWDGADLAAYDPARLRARIGAVFQTPTRYDLTAGENIGVGDVAAIDDGERVRAAAERADVARVVEGLAAGYATMLSRVHVVGAAGARGGAAPCQGTQLSGGQWQRVGLARAFMRDGADLLILDEPSAGLDPEAEHRIRDGLRALRTTRTALLISHRLADVRFADRIVVLADGQVAEQGTHTELLAADGDYARLFALQADGYQDSTAPIGIH